MTEQQLETLDVPGDNLNEHKKQLAGIIAQTEQITLVDGRHPTVIPYLSISRNSRLTPLIPSVVTPSFCLILQGRKKLHYGSSSLEYLPGDYMVSMINLPAFAQIAGVTSDTPYIGLRIDITTQEIASVMTQAGISVKQRDKKLSTAAFIGKADSGLLELFSRLLKLTVTASPGKPAIYPDSSSTS